MAAAAAARTDYRFPRRHVRADISNPGNLSPRRFPDFRGLI